MGRIKEITARILFVVMFMGAMAEFNTLAMASEADVSSVFESVVNGLKERDESESSGAVYFESALEEGYGDGSVSEYAKSIINEHTFYSELSEEEKITVRQELGYREDTMGELCQKGYTIEESKTKALIMQQLDISYEDMMSMVWAFGSEGKAESEAVKFVMGLDKYTGFYTDENEKDVTELMVMGFEFEKAVNICVVKNCVADESISGAGVTVKDIAASEGAVAVSDTELSQIAEENSVNPERLNEILKSIGMSIDELYAKITEYKEKYGIIPKAMLMADDEEDVFADYIKEIENSKAPFGKEKNVLESVSESTGALSYTDNVASIPGVNDMDFQLNLIYNSDDRISYSRDYGYNVWHFNIPVRTSRYTAEGMYVETEDGVRRTVTTALRGDDVTYKWGNNYYDDVLFCKDKNATVKDSKYMLKYNDGRIIYFNREGKALREEDRFGNYINIEWGSEYATFKITNNSGMSISNAFERTEDGRVMYVYVKDENGNVLKKIKYEFETEASGFGMDSYSRIKRKTDENGKVTEYTYKPYDTYPVRNVEYREVCLTEIKYYTGLTVKYEYEDAYANEDKKTYRRIDTITYTEGGKQLYKADYSYSKNNYLYQPDKNVENQKGDSYDYSTSKTVDGLRIERYFGQSGFKKNEATYLGPTNKAGMYEYRTYRYYDQSGYLTGYNPNEIEVERGQAKYRLKYDYSKTGLLTNYWGPKSTENYFRRNDDELNKVSYRYGDYGLQTKKTYQKEKGVTVTEESQLTSDNKNISQTIIYTTSKTDPLSKTTYSYDSKGNVTTVGNYKNGSTPIYTYYTYDSKGINVIETKQNNIVNKAEYDVFGNITSKTDGNGHKMTYTYDIYGNQTGSNDGRYTTRTVYDYEANKVTYYDECGYMKVYDYDPVGNLAEVIDTTTTKYTYNENDMMLESAVVGGKAKLKVEYDVLNEVSKRQLVDPNNNDNVMYQEKYNHSTQADYETETVKKGYDNEEYTDITRKDFDGNVIYTEKDGTVTESTYDLRGNMLTKTVGTGNDAAVTKMEYDGLGRMLKITKPEGGVYTYSYDMLGRKTSETAPNGGVTSYVYDDSGRLVEQSSPLTSNSNKSVKKYTYDKNSNVLTESIKNSLQGSTDTYRTTTYTYDDRNNMIKVQSGSGSNASYTEYEYDGVGNVLKEKAANGANVTSYTYDSKYRLTKMQDPMGLCEEYGYDNAGNMIYKKDKNGTTLKYDYDAMCRITKEYAVSGSSEVIKKMYTYNDKNNLSEINDNKTRFIYGYHSKYNRLASVSMYQDNKRTYMTYGYDGRGNMTSKFISIFLKNFVNDNVSLVQYMYTYDKNDNMTKQTYKMSSKDSYQDFAAYSYDNMDRLVKETRGDITTSYTYNMAGLVTGLTNKKGANVISTYSNTYNYDGNVAKAVENGVTKNYTYDNMNRLVSEIIGGDEYTYSYDVSGNRTRLDVELSDDYSYCTTYKYDKNNRLLNTFKTENLNNYITDYYYDNNGNQITKVSSETKADNDKQSLGIKTAGELSENQKSEYFTYNVFNQLKEYRNTEGTKATYEYAVNGYRYSKSVNGSVTKYIWDGDDIVAELNSDYTAENIYLYGKDMAADSEGNNYIYDIHGSVTDIINAEGNKVKNYEYDAFGNVEAESNVSNENPWQYCGEYRDRESGLIYLRNRYYDSETGRFISEDPAKDGGNWYSYCDGNPRTFKDPSGLTLVVDLPEKEENNNVKVVHSKGNTSSKNSMVNDTEIGYLKRDLNELLRNEDGSYDGNVVISDSGKISLDMINNSSELAGYKLLDALIKSSETVTIEIMNKNTKDYIYLNEIDYNMEDGCMYYADDNLVLYNYSSSIDVFTVDDSSGSRVFNIEQSIQYISLTHELVHAYRDITGQSNYNASVTYTGVVPEGYSGKGQNAEEFETVGLVQWNNQNSSGRITENDIRRQRGLPLRGWYN